MVGLTDSGGRRRLGVSLLGWDRASDVGVAVDLRLGARFVDQAGEDCANREVVDLAKRVDADSSGPVDDNEARRAPQLEPAHRDGQGDPGIVGVHADRERYAVLVQERFERHRGHGLVVFEHAVEPEHGEIAAEGLLDALGLRKLRPGDAVTHSFHGFGDGVLESSGAVIDGMKEAQARESRSMSAMLLFMGLRDGFRRLVKTGVESLPLHVNKLQVLYYSGLAIVGYGQSIVGVHGDIGDHALDFVSFETFVESGNQERSRLYAKTLGAFLWLDNNNTKQVPNVDPILEIWLFLLNQLAKPVHSFCIVVGPSVATILITHLLAQQETLLVTRQFCEIGDDTGCIAVEGLHHRPWHGKDVKACVLSIVVFILFAGMEESDHGVLRHIQEPGTVSI